MMVFVGPVDIGDIWSLPDFSSREQGFAPRDSAELRV